VAAPRKRSLRRVEPFLERRAGQDGIAAWQRCELIAPDGSTQWRFGPPDADSAITGPAAAFCRVAVRRLAADRSGLDIAGPDAATALRLVRTYAA
jgi:hypothetical protein